MISLQVDYTVLIISIGTALLGIISGVLGVFSLLRQHSLLGDAISHAAFPGIAIAFLLTHSKNPAVLLFGGTVAGLIGAWCVTMITHTTRLKKDAALGIILSVFFGFGLVLLTHIQKLPISSQSVLNKFLFGNAATLLPQDLYLLAAVGAAVLFVIYLFYIQFSLISFDSQYAHALGYNVPFWDALLTFLQVIIIVVGLQTVGVVLMSSMLIAPAAAARQWTNRLPAMLLIAAFFGATSSAAGSLLSCTDHRLPTGPIIVVIMSAIVLISVLFAPKRGIVWSRL